MNVISQVQRVESVFYYLCSIIVFNVILNYFLFLVFILILVKLYVILSHLILIKNLLNQKKIYIDIYTLLYLLTMLGSYQGIISFFSSNIYILF